MSTRKKSPSPRTRSPMGKDGSSPRSKANPKPQRQGKPGLGPKAERSTHPGAKPSPTRASKPSARKRRANRKAARPADEVEKDSPPNGSPLDLTTAPSLERPPVRRKTADLTAPAPNTTPPAQVAAGGASDPAKPPTPTVVAAEGLWPTETSDEPQARSDAALEQDAFLGIGSPVLPTTEYSHEFDGTDMAAADPSDDAVPPLEGSVDAEIRKLRQRLDDLLASRPKADRPSEDASPLGAPESTPGESEPISEPASELLESRERGHRWGPTGLRERASEVDPFGLDPEFEETAQPLLGFLFERYFRTVVTGADHLPSTGAGLVVANRSGALPFDGAMLREAVKRHQPSGRGVRWLAEDWSFYLPFLGVALNRLGAVRACPENAARLLEAGHLIGCFPEGSGGSKKLYSDRYKLKRFGRGGFVRLALTSRTPIIPCAIIGAEEAYPVIHRFDNLSRILGIDYLPITPTFPALGLAGLLPAPSRWRIAFGTPISIDDYGPEAADDHVLVGRLTERVRNAVSELLDAGLKQRKNAWL